MITATGNKLRAIFRIIQVQHLRMLYAQIAFQNCILTMTLPNQKKQNQKKQRNSVKNQLFSPYHKKSKYTIDKNRAFREANICLLIEKYLA